MKKYERYFSCRCLLFTLVFFWQITIFSSCSLKNYTTHIDYSFKSQSGEPDYSNLDYWAAHPWKNDPSDNVPASLKAKNVNPYRKITKVNDSLADVFFIYPTTYLDPNVSLGWNAPIDDEKINRKTDNTAILYQASVFNEHCRVFSPRYRQANLKAFYTDDKATAEAAFDLAYGDIKKAFEYYLLHYNHGRPIIIASHSQGTRHAGRLLKDFFENKPLLKQLVCAYVIGLPVFDSYFKTLKPCTDAYSTGCFVTWRTFKRGADPDFVREEKEHAYVINPLTWKLDNDFAGTSLNKGGLLKNFDKVIPGLVSAQVHGNILWVSKPKFFGNIFLTTKNYHIADYNLFYMNIRENVMSRIGAWIRLH